jgi:hypothetical protein
MGQNDTYAASPLGKFSAELLREIARLKKKYPAQNTVEDKYAHRQIEAIEEILKALHESILPKFDKYQKLSLMDIGSIAWSAVNLSKLNEVFYSRRFTLHSNVMQEIENQLPTLQKQQKNSNDIKKELVTLINQKQKALCEKADTIPYHEPSKSILEQITNNILDSTTDLKNLDLKKKESISDFEEELRNKLFKTIYPADSSDPLAFPVQEGLAGIVVANPMMFELCELIFKLKENLPKDLEQLVPFLNPMTFDLDAAKLPIPDFAKDKLFEMVPQLSGTLKNKLDGQGQPTWNFILNTEILSPDPIEMNFNKRLSMLLTKFNLVTFTQVQEYFTHYKDSPHVQSLQFRTKLLDGFKKAESDSTTVLVQNHSNEVQKKLNIDHLDSLSALKATTEALISNNSLLKQNSGLQDSLKQKAASYSEKKVIELLKTHPQLMKDLHAYKGNKQFSEDKLPDFIIGMDSNDKVGFIEYKKFLSEDIENKLTLLQSHQELLAEKITIQTTQQKKLLEAWRAERIKKYNENAQQTSDKLNELKDLLTKVKNANDALKPASLEIKALEPLIENKKALSSKYQQLSEVIIPLLQNFETLASLTAEEKLFDSDQSLQKNLKDKSQPLLEELKALSKTIHSEHQAYNKEVHTLESTLGKAKSEAEFIKNMQFADPEKMQQVQNDLTDKLSVLKNKEDELTQKLSQIAKDILKEEDDTPIKKSPEIEEKEKKIAEINEEINKIIDSVYTRVNKDALFTEDELSALFPKEENEASVLEHLINHHDKIKPFLEAVLKKVTPKVEATKKAISNYTSQIASLKTIQTELTQNSEQIPFKLIDQFKTLKDTKFLPFIGLSNKSKLLNEFRQQQESLKPRFFFTDYDIHLKECHSLLTSAINKKIEKLEKNINGKKSDEKFLVNESYQTFIQFEIDSWEKQVAEKAKLESEIAAQIPKKDPNVLIQLKEEQQQKRNELQQAQNEKTSLSNDKEIFKQITELVATIQGYQHRIQNLSTESLSIYEPELYAKIVLLQEERPTVQKKIEQLTKNIEQLGKKEHYEENIILISKLLETTQHTLNTTIQTVVDTTSLNDLILQDKANLDEFKQHLDLNKNFNQLEALLEQYNKIIQSINQQDKLIIQLEKHIPKINNKDINQNVKLIKHTQKQLYKQAETISRSLIEILTTELKEVQVKARLFKDNEFQEHIQTHTKNSEEIANIMKRLDDEFSVFKSNPAFTPKQIKKVTEIENTIREQLTESSVANQALIQRIEDRKEIVNNLLIPKINAYEDRRKNRYPHKSDNTECSALLVQLQANLNTYIKTGESGDTLSTINLNKNRYSGYHFQALMCRIQVELLDLDKKIPKDYYAKIPKKPSAQDLHTQAKAILDNQNTESPEYVEAINKLFDLIDDMKNKWPDISSLAEKLNQDIDEFISNHPDALPSEEAYTEFKAHFTARLHSEDEVLSKHRKPWKTNLANFAIGLVSLGIALGVKLIYSKVHDNKYSLFFNKTKKLEQTEKIEDIVEKDLEQGIKAPKA